MSKLCIMLTAGSSCYFRMICTITSSSTWSDYQKERADGNQVVQEMFLKEIYKHSVACYTIEADGVRIIFTRWCSMRLVNYADVNWLLLEKIRKHAMWLECDGVCRTL